MIVACIQMIMLAVVAMVIFPDTGTIISMPDSVTTLALRFVCTVLMHLQVEADVRQGLRMMKYLPNHTKDFSAPVNAFVVGLLQCMAGLATELACIFYLGTINTPIDVIIRFIALGSIAKVDDFYYNALPSENRVLGKVPELTVKLQRRDMRESKDTKGKCKKGRKGKGWGKAKK